MVIKGMKEAEEEVERAQRADCLANVLCAQNR